MYVGPCRLYDFHCDVYNCQHCFIFLHFDDCLTRILKAIRLISSTKNFGTPSPSPYDIDVTGTNNKNALASNFKMPSAVLTH